VVRAEETDDKGKGKDGPVRPDARPLDTAWETPFKFEMLELNRNDLPVRDVEDSVLRSDLENAIEMGKDPNRMEVSPLAEFEEGVVPCPESCARVWLQRNFA
jgi:hypothetical protein